MNQLKRVTKNMSQQTAISVIANGNIAVVNKLRAVCIYAENFLGTPKQSMHGVLGIIDEMGIYEEDLGILFRYCKNNIEKFVTLLWAYAVGSQLAILGDTPPEYTYLEFIKNIIECRKQKQKINNHFDFEDAKEYIKYSINLEIDNQSIYN